MIQFRKAIIPDKEQIVNLLSTFHLPVEDLEENPDNFIVAVLENDVVGCIALETYDEHGLLRSFAVATQHQDKGIGRQLYTHLISTAKEKGIKTQHIGW
jgi:amino-acid N-acetyltransferase